MPTLSDTALGRSRITNWIMPLTLAAATLIIVTASWFSAKHHAAAADAVMRNELLKTAVQMAETLDPALARRLSFTLEDTEHPAFTQIVERMRAFSQVRPNRGLFSVALRDGVLVFGPESYPPGTPIASPPGEVYLEPPPEAFRVFDENVPLIFGPYEDEYGSFITALAPVIDPRSKEILMAVASEVSKEDWEKRLADAVRPVHNRTVLLLLFLLFAALLTWYRISHVTASDKPTLYVEAALIIVLGGAFSWWFGSSIAASETRERNLVFANLAEMQKEIITDTFQTLDVQLELLGHFFEASESVDAREFTHFTTPILQQNPITALGWLSTTHEGRRLTTYLEPAQAPAMLFGLDHQTIPELAETVELVLSAYADTGSARLDWTDGAGRTTPLYVYYRAIRPSPANLPELDGRQTGAVFAALPLQHLLDQALRRAGHNAAYVTLRLYDLQAPEAGPVAVHPVDALNAPDVHGAVGPANLFALHFLNRTFKLIAEPTPDFMQAYPIQRGRIVGLTGLLLTALLTLFAGAIRSRRRALDLEASEFKYRRLFNAMTSGFALHELVFSKDGKPVDYRFLEVNAAFEEQSGIRAEELIGRTLYEVLPHAEPIWLARYAPVAITGISTRFEHYVPELNRHFDIIAYSPQKNRFAILLTDITPKKRVEEQLARNEAMQRILTGMATRFINLPSDKIDEATQSALEEIGRFHGVDRSYQFFYDFEKRIMINTHEWCGLRISPQIDNLKAIPFDLDPDMVVTHVKGSPFLLPDVNALPGHHPLREHLLSQNIRSLITIPLMAGADCFGFIGFDSVHDIRVWTNEEVNLLKILSKLLSNAHQRKRAEERHAQLERQILHAQKLESLGVMAGGIAHDFNNLLTTILGNAELAMRDTSVDSPIRESLEDISTGARRAADLCRQMLAYAGKGRFVTEPCSLNAMIEEMMNLLRTSISKRARVELKLDPDLPYIYGDASQIRQIILNLTINASEALADQGGLITLRTGVQYCTAETFAQSPLDRHLPAGPYVMFAVTDTGVGMTAETLGKIFDPFFSTKMAGRGLGLSAVMGIVRSHKGALQVHSEPGKGTTFTLLLPVVEEEAVTFDEPSVTLQTGKEPDALKGGTILLVDDEPSILTVGRRVFERLGFEVITASNGPEALRLFDTHRDRITRVFLDLTMPGMTGDEVLLSLRQQSPHLPVVLVSGYSAEALAIDLSPVKPTAFLQKPYELERLRSLLKRIDMQEVEAASSR